MNEIMILDLLYAVVAAGGFAFVGYMNARKEGEGFDLFKAGSTLIVGFLVGAIFYFTGVPVDEQGVLLQMASYAGVVALLMKLFQMVGAKTVQPPT